MQLFFRLTAHCIDRKKLPSKNRGQVKIARAEHCRSKVAGRPLLRNHRADFFRNNYDRPSAKVQVRIFHSRPQINRDQVAYKVAASGPYALLKHGDDGSINGTVALASCLTQRQRTDTSRADIAASANKQLELLDYSSVCRRIEAQRQRRENKMTAQTAAIAEKSGISSG
ncbi:hypothetical protein [Cellulomonas fengjieae]|uniref:hypothetical protein n=1 Tax=Cellulomonas fengjieae TaxID=2819978 RepID=UPI001AAFFCF4|nr:hypothetical protein [Cellulomonas fengjieae]MBO3100620.1 hypothetical protein [Cellulomonas fengjieae]